MCRVEMGSTVKFYEVSALSRLGMEKVTQREREREVAVCILAE